MNSKCGVCADIKDIYSDNLSPLSLSWRIIKETKNFIVTPSLGSIVDGYIVIWPKKHILSMKNLVDEELYDLIRIVEYFNNIMKEKYGKQIVVFEHGQIEGCSEVGCGVNHAHIHMVALDDAKLFLNKSESIYFTMKEYPSYKDFYQDNYCPETDYMLISSTSFESTKVLSYGNSRVSQALRKILAECCGQSQNWNWREEMAIPKALNTMNILRGEECLEKSLDLA
ncbi:MAG: HIT domain-containing protein [Candidatus Electrothrix sp. YB6]